MRPEVGRAAQRYDLVGGRATPTSDAASSGSHVEAGVGGETSVHDDRTEADADPVLELVGGLDHLVHGHLLGQGDECDLAAGRIGEELDDVGGLGAHRAGAGRVEQALGRRQEGHGVTGGGGVHEDEVGHVLAFEALHLAEDEDVTDPGDGGRHHVEGSRRHQALRYPLHPVVGEVLEQGVVRGDPAALARCRLPVIDSSPPSSDSS